MGDEQEKLRAWAGAKSSSDIADPTTRLRPGEKPGTLRHPFRVIDRADYLAQIKGAGIFKRAETAPIEDVQLARLHGVQKTVNAQRLEEHVANPGLTPKGTRGEHGGKVDMPTVVRVNGVDAIHDGHHRASSAFLRGQKSMKARVVDLDKEGWKPA
jgi:hypothetical protein